MRFKIYDKTRKRASAWIHTSYAQAVAYKKLLQKRFPDSDWYIVKLINET